MPQWQINVQRKMSCNQLNGRSKPEVESGKVGVGHVGDVTCRDVVWSAMAPSSMCADA